jgi:hypothetical protein
VAGRGLLHRQQQPEAPTGVHRQQEAQAVSTDEAVHHIAGDQQEPSTSATRGRRCCHNSLQCDSPLNVYDSAAADRAYRAGRSTLDWYQGGEYVITDGLGMPVHPDWYSDEFVRLLMRVGLPRITLLIGPERGSGVATGPFLINIPRVP